MVSTRRRTRSSAKAEEQQQANLNVEEERNARQEQDNLPGNNENTPGISEETPIPEEAENPTILPVEADEPIVETKSEQEEETTIDYNTEEEDMHLGNEDTEDTSIDHVSSIEGASIPDSPIKDVHVENTPIDDTHIEDTPIKEKRFEETHAEDNPIINSPPEEEEIPADAPSEVMYTEEAPKENIEAENAVFDNKPDRFAPYKNDEPNENLYTEFTENDDVEESEEVTNDVDQNVPQKKSKKKKKRRKKKARAVQKPISTTLDDDSGVEIEYVSEKIDLPKWDPNYSTFEKIFETFKIEEKVLIKEEEEKQAVPTKKPIDPILNDDDDELDKDKEEDKTKLSKKQMKKQSRMEIAQLKQMVSRPDVVEMHDVNSKDPQLLVYLKAYKNTVPVPRHWCFKRKYLAGKRGFLKPPFELPDFIKQTGIMEMRAAMQEKEDSKTLKSKQRGKIRPKLGKIDIDYQKLHDAFFKFQTKPKMTIHGDLYYEGKEFEIRLKEKKPGDLSDDLRTALGMPVGPGKDLIPPPWLIAMQRYGPPPSYPNLNIPGLNAPIPEGSSFGYHAGGWGKPPVDEMGKPLYGDVFGTQIEQSAQVLDEESIDKTPWGEFESESESEEESEEEEEEEDQTGLVTPGDAGLVTPSGMSSVGAGLETPDIIELRKRKEIEDAMETGGDTPALYTVLTEKRTNVGSSMMGSAHTYDLAPPKKAGDGVEITLDPSELELEPAAMAAKYDDTMKEREAVHNREDLSDMVAEHAAKKKRKKPTESGKAAKKYKEFKF